MKRALWWMAGCLLSLPAYAAEPSYWVAIGNNGLPEAGDEEVRPLHYADDDAAAVVSLGRELGVQTTLLTVLDADSTRRYPELAAVARPPTVKELRQVAGELQEKLASDRRAGAEPTVLLFFSGHGGRSKEGAASLALLDGSLTRQMLYEELLANLPARYVHLVVDACHAEAVVRPRDKDAKVVAVSDAEVAALAARTTLGRFPSVGAVMASTSGSESHEWDVYRSGVFTHELISGLRGGADVNQDGRVEYSELYGFLAAANREVGDPRAHLAVVVVPPAVNRRVAIVDRKDAPSAPRLVGRIASSSHFYVEDETGRRLVDVRPEAGVEVDLMLPPDKTLYLRSRDQEAEFRLRASERRQIERLNRRSPSTNARGALESSMRRGLFATPFGPAFYVGFVEGKPDFVAVPLEPPPERHRLAAHPSLRSGAIASFGVAGALSIAGAAFVGLAVRTRSDFFHNQFERQAVELGERYALYQGLAIATCVAAGALVAVGAGLWSMQRSDRGKIRLTSGPGEVGLALYLDFW